MNWLRNLWWATQRKIDVQILWPICKAKAKTLGDARHAFMMHAITDPAWVRHYGENLWKAICELS